MAQENQKQKQLITEVMQADDKDGLYQPTISKMETVQTAVEWLIQQVKSKEWQDMYIWHKEEIFKQAKDIEKEQMINAYNQDLYGGLSGDKKFDDGEQYYNETYNK